MVNTVMISITGYIRLIDPSFQNPHIKTDDWEAHQSRHKD